MGDKRRVDSEVGPSNQDFAEWQSLIHQISGVLYECAMDEHWTMNWISKGIEKLTGYSPSEIINNNARSYNSIIHPNDRAMVRETVEYAVSNKEYFSIEYRIVDSSGEIKWVEERGKAEYDNQGNVEFLRGIIVDATGAKEAKRIARESQQKYRALFESSMDGIAFSNLDGKFEEVNPAFEAMTGYTEEELERLSYRDITPSEYVEKEREIHHPQLMERGYSDLYEKEYIRKDGSRVPVRIRTWLLRDNQGNPSHVAAVVQNMSKERKTAKALKRSQEQLRLYFSESPIGIEILDEEGRIIRANKSALDIFGVEDEQEVIGFSLLEDPNVPEYVKESIRNHELCSYESHFDYSVVRKHNLYNTNKTGTVFLETRIIPLKGGDDSDFKGFILQVEDVTERKQALESLKESEERFYALFRDSPIGIEMLDENGCIIRANSAALEIFGVSNEEEIIGFNLLEDPNTAEHVKMKIRNRESYEFESRFDYSIVKKHGLYSTSKSGFAYLQTSITPLGSDEDSDFRGFMVQLQDVTERKRMLMALQDSEEQYRTTLEAMDDPMCVVDRDLRINLINPALKKWLNKLGLDGNVVGKSITEALPFLTEETLEEYRRVFKDGIVFRTHDKIRLGKSTIHTETVKVPIMSRGTTVQVLTQIRDITSKRRNQQKLARSEKRYRTLIESMNLGFLFHDSNGRIKSTNPAARDILGVIEEECRNRRFEELGLQIRRENNSKIVPDDLPIRKSLETGKQTQPSIFRVFNSTKNEWKWVKMKSIPLPYTEPESHLEIYTILEDVTDEYRAQKELQMERDRAQNYLDIAGAMIVALDVEGNIQEINEKGCSILGYPKEKLLGKNWMTNFIPPRIRPEIERIFNEHKQGNISEFAEHENAILTKSGEERIIEWRNTPLVDEEGNAKGVLSSGVDVTKRKQMEENLRTAAETANLYLDLMSHDIRNNLQSIMIAVDIVREHNKSEKASSFLDIILDATDDATHLIRKVGETKGFLSTPLRKMLLTDVIRVAVSDFKKNYPQMDIELRERVEKPFIFADEYIFNLIENILENSAIHNDSDNPSVQIEVDKFGEGYEISIVDNGPGIPNSKKKAIFDANRRYGGVGIPQALKIADKYGAEISVHDRVKGRPELGAEFRIWLPKSPS